jgi:hypothetical protein
MTLKKLKRWFVFLIILAIAGYFLLPFAKQQWLVYKVNQGFGLKPDLARQVAVLDLAQKAMTGSAHPNIFAHLTPQHATDLADSIQAAFDKEKPPANLSRLSLKYRDLTFHDGSISFNIDFDTSFKSVPVEGKGTLLIEAGTALNASAIRLIPIGAGIQFKSLKLLGKTDDSVLPNVLNGLLAPLVSSISQRISSFSLPVNLGIVKQIDIKSELLKVPEIKEVTEGPDPYPAIMLYENGAVFPLKSGLYVIGTARLVPPQEYRVAIDAIKEIEKVATQNLCAECTFDLLAPKNYWNCQKDYLECTKRKYGRPEPEKKLTPLEMLALMEMKRRKDEDPESKRIYEHLKILDSPWYSVDPTLPANDAQYESLVRQCQNLLNKKASQIDPKIASASGSVVAVSKDFIAQTFRTISKLALVRAVLKIDRKEEDIPEYTLKTDSAPDLKCTENAMGCNSNFNYTEPYTPRGCSGGCGTRNCHNVWPFGDVCVNGIDLNCEKDRIWCNTQKEAERVAYEGRKSAAQVKFDLDKARCEVEKEAQKKGCELNQGFLNATQSMEFGRVKAHAVITNLDGGIFVKGVGISDDLKTINAELQLEGKTHVQVDWEMTPLNAGHLVCPFPAGGVVHADVTLDRTPLTFQAVMKDPESKDTRLAYTMDERKLTVRMFPPPAIALLSQNPQLALACAPGNAISNLFGATGQVAKLVFALKDEIELKIPQRTIELPIFQDQGGLPFKNSKLEKSITSGAVIMEVVNQ